MAVIPVVIQKDQNNKGRCFAKPDPFKAKLGDSVTFIFPDEPRAHIEFTGASPFGEAGFVLRPGPDTGKTGVATKEARNAGLNFDYAITWPGGGKGNGGGEVGPSR